MRLLEAAAAADAINKYYRNVTAQERVDLNGNIFVAVKSDKTRKVSYYYTTQELNERFKTLHFG